MKLFNWIGSALSENGQPSSKRLISFLFALVVCFGVCWDVISKIQNQFAEYLFVGLLVAIFLLLGVATVPQIIELWKGRKTTEAPPPAPDQTKVATAVETKIEQS